MFHKIIPALVLTLLLTACLVTNNSKVNSTIGSIDKNSQPKIATWRGGSSMIEGKEMYTSMTALMQGTLAIKNGCLVVDDTLPIFGKNQFIWDKTRGLLIYFPTKQVYAIGDTVQWGGGSAPPESLADWAEIDMSIIHDCGAKDFFLM